MIRPILDRIIVKPIVKESDSTIVTPDAFLEKPTTGVVVALPSTFVVGDMLLTPEYIGISVDDLVRYGEYNAEPIEVAGEKLVIIRLGDVRYVDSPDTEIV